MTRDTRQKVLNRRQVTDSRVSESDNVKLLRVVRDLPRMQRQTVVKSYGLGGHQKPLGERAVARSLGISVDAVRRHHENALEELRRQFRGPVSV